MTKSTEGYRKIALAINADVLQLCEVLENIFPDTAWDYRKKYKKYQSQLGEPVSKIGKKEGSNEVS